MIIGPSPLALAATPAALLASTPVSHMWISLAADMATCWAFIFLLGILVYLRGRGAGASPAAAGVTCFLVFACGLGLTADVVLSAWPPHRVSEAFKITTACAAWLSVVALLRGLPRALSEEHGSDAGQAALDEQLRSLLACAPEAMVIIDDAGRIILANDQARRVFGFEIDELLNQPIEKLIPPGPQDAQAPFWATLELPAHGVERDARKRDGAEIPVEIRLSPVLTHQGRRVAATIRDITERRRLEETCRVNEELRRSNSDLEMFASIASHDLKEPLRMVSSFCQLLAKRYAGKLDADADQYIGYAVDGATRMQKLVDDLLAYSHIGRRELEVKRVDAKAALDLAVANLRGAISESGASVTSDELPTILADDAPLVELFQNLIGNAIKYRSEAPPHVHVSASRHGREWRFVVRDNGIGIDPQHHKRIFQIFQRLHSRTEYPGTGIGLALCQRIVERFGGAIGVESATGEGSMFWFRLPALSDEGGPAPGGDAESRCASRGFAVDEPLAIR